ncbi:MAG: hypothetical protein KBC84_07560 [Proteobacteria bacterium]|nr:hypothetical protein [Pseudomonadota bacterium]
MEKRFIEIEDSQFELIAWNEVLKTLSDSQFVLGQGIKNLNFKELFPGLEKLWDEFFQSVETDVEFVGCAVQEEFPNLLTRITSVEVAGTRAVLGIDDSTEETITKIFLQQATDVAADTIVEYLERRFISSLQKTCILPNTDFFYVGEDKQGTDILASVCLKLKIQGQSVDIWIGLGRSLLENLNNLKKKTEGNNNKVLLSLSLFEMTLPTANLIDITKVDNKISFDLPFSNKVSLILEDRIVAQGILFKYQNKFALEVKRIQDQLINIPENMAYVVYEVAKAEVEQRFLADILKNNKIILSDTEISDSCAIVVNGEEVARAVLGEYDGSVVAKTIG